MIQYLISALIVALAMGLLVRAWRKPAAVDAATGDLMLRPTRWLVGFGWLCLVLAASIAWVRKSLDEYTSP